MWFTFFQKIIILTLAGFWVYRVIKTFFSGLISLQDNRTKNKIFLTQEVIRLIRSEVRKEIRYWFVDDEDKKPNGAAQ